MWIKEKKYPPYKPDLAPFDHSFSKLKSDQREKRSNDDDDVKKAILELFRLIFERQSFIKKRLIKYKDI